MLLNHSTGTSESTIAQWKIGVDYPDDIICAGPNYYYPYAADGVHLTASGYQQLGEKYGKVFYQKVVLENDWQPLQPTTVETGGRVITVNFHVPNPPLVWDSILPAPNQSTLTEWRNGKGFEVYSGYTDWITISSVEISGNAVRITCASDLPASDLKVAYAYHGGTKRENGTYRWGLLKDSDTFRGYNTGVAQPNYCVSFVLPVSTTTTSAPADTQEPTAVPTPNQVPGDVNTDGSTDIVDALLIAQYYVGLNPQGFNALNADTNCDNSIDIIDALLIAQYYVGLISAFC